MSDVEDYDPLGGRVDRLGDRAVIRVVEKTSRAAGVAKVTMVCMWAGSHRSDRVSPEREAIAASKGGPLAARRCGALVRGSI